MRYNKKIIAIAAMSAIVIFIQCSKTFKKTDEQVAVEEEQSGIEKKKSTLRIFLLFSEIEKKKHFYVVKVVKDVITD